MLSVILSRALEEGNAMCIASGGGGRLCRKGICSIVYNLFYDNSYVYGKIKMQ